MQKIKQLVVTELAGVDVYWDGMVEEESSTKDPSGIWYRKQRMNTSKSKWGTLRVYMFPFIAIFRYDDCDEYAVFSAAPVVNKIRRFPKQGVEQLKQFVRINTEGDVLQTRIVRQRLRSLDGQDIKVMVTYPEDKVIPGQFHIVSQWFVEDVWKNTRTGEVLSLAPGFSFQVTTTMKHHAAGQCTSLVCGAPETGVHPDNFVKQAEDAIDEDGPQVLSREALGFEYDYFSGDDPVVQHLADEDNLDPLYVEYVQKLYQSYRDHIYDDYVWKTRTLSYQFWVSALCMDFFSYFVFFLFFFFWEGGGGGGRKVVVWGLYIFPSFNE